MSRSELNGENTTLLPLFPSLGWWRARCAPGKGPEGEYQVTGKEFLRGHFAGGLMLAVPLAGGASVSKRLREDFPADSLRLSDHGKWRREHLGAFATVYGKTPFFIHLFPDLESIYRDSELDDSYAAFSGALYALTVKWLCELPELRADSARNEAIRFRMEEMKTKVNTDLSIFDAIFRFGKETALSL